MASSFSHKPYLFNRSNLERFSSGRFCAACPLAERRGAGGCPFDASYETLQSRLFRSLPPAGARPESAAAPPSSAPPSASLLPLTPPAAGPAPRRPLVWVHGEALGPANPALLAHPDAPALFVFDAGPGAVPLAPGRLRFLRECLAELPVDGREGEVASELLAAAAALGADGIVTSRAVDPRFATIAAQVAVALPLHVLEPEPFVALPFDGPGAPELRRFSRYWRQAEPLVWGGASADTGNR